MSQMHSTGTKPLRPLVNRRQRPEPKNANEGMVKHVIKPVIEGPHRLVRSVQDGQSNLSSPAQTPEDPADPLELMGDFLDATAVEAFDSDRTVGTRPVLQFRVDGESLRIAFMGISDKQPHVSQQLTVEATPDLGPGVSLVGHMGLAEQQSAPGSAVEPPEAAHHPMEDIVVQLYKDQEEARTASATSDPDIPPNQQAARSTPTVQPTAKPDTSQDEKVALKTQIGYSVDDLAYLQGIEKRLAKLVKQYPKAKSHAELQKTYRMACDQTVAMALQVQEYQSAYAEKYDLAIEPLKKGVENLAKQGRGGEPGSQPVPKKPLNTRVQRRDHGGHIAGLRERFKKENPSGDASLLPDDAADDSLEDLPQPHVTIKVGDPLSGDHDDDEDKDAKKIGKHSKEHVDASASVAKIPDDFSSETSKSKSKSKGNEAEDDSTLDLLDDMLTELNTQKA